MTRTSLTGYEKEQFLRDGFIVIRDAVPRSLSDRAGALVADRLPKNERRLLVPPEVPAELRAVADVGRLPVRSLGRMGRDAGSDRQVPVNVG